MKKSGRLLISLMVLFVVLVGCGNKLDSEEKALYSKKAEEAIKLLNNGKTEELRSQFDDRMKKLMSKEDVDAVVEEIKKVGTFEKVEKSSVEEKEAYYTTMTIVKYADKNVIFTISYNDNKEIAGLYFK